MISPAAYQRNRRFWLDAVSSACAKNGSKNDWAKWSRNEVVMTEVLGDANPIIDLWSLSRERALRVIQYPLGSPLASFAASLDTIDDFFDTPPRSGTRSVELVIALQLTELTAGPALKLLEFWVSGTPSVEQMQHKIDVALEAHNSGAGDTN
jgi:hypothetical protein